VYAATQEVKRNVLRGIYAWYANKRDPNAVEFFVNKESMDVPALLADDILVHGRKVHVCFGYMMLACIQC
jgi:hypothetical protein